MNTGMSRSPCPRYARLGGGLVWSGTETTEGHTNDLIVFIIGGAYAIGYAIAIIKEWK